MTSIDLSRYGASGTVTVGVPPYRRYVEYQNFLGGKVRMRGRDVVVDGVPQGDLEIAGAMLYVREAPFEPSVEGWLAFCDTLADPAAPYRLFDEIKEAVKEVDEDPTGPFASSPAPGTGSSD